MNTLSTFAAILCISIASASFANTGNEPTNEPSALVIENYANGAVKMIGSYLDEARTIAHGTFRFFHANGQLESTGEYVNGLKKGVWLRYDDQGRPLAERVYGAGSFEEIALELGWSVQADKK
ncbi:MAG: hypothetical protein KDB88_02745 [Flavobacteriales bacterium]|nr:hypothetical protein [Flavobacteriales bacterium]